MINRWINQNDGFSITEALVAQVIIVIGAAAIISSFAVVTRFNAEAEDRTIATNIAQLVMEKVMNGRYRYIVVNNPPGVYPFDSETQKRPFWIRNSEGEWITSLPQGRYKVSYPGPDGTDSDPLIIRITILWKSQKGGDSSVHLDSMVSMTPGRFRK